MRIAPKPGNAGRWPALRLLGGIVLLLALPLWALAQSGGTYTLRKHVVAAGVVTSGGSFRLTGTIGQPVAALQSGGAYRLTGGFHGPRSTSDRLLCDGFEGTACP